MGRTHRYSAYDKDWKLVRYFVSLLYSLIGFPIDNICRVDLSDWNWFGLVDQMLNWLVNIWWLAVVVNSDGECM